MAARLQLKLGLVAEHDRLDDSPDTLVVVEPSVGSVARSKGHLYLLVTSRVELAPRARGDPPRRRDDPERVLLRRIGRDPGLPPEGDRDRQQAARSTRPTGSASSRPTGNGPIGVGLAVVRGNEMYVATVGPAEAYLIRQARLSTLPDPHRERGLPSSGLEPDVWRGEISVGDSLVLVSPEHRRAGSAPTSSRTRCSRSTRSRRWSTSTHRFVAADGSGSDGAIAFEATEVAPTSRARTLVPVRPGRAARRRARPLADPARRQRPGGRRRDVRRRPATPGSRPAARSSGVVARVQDLHAAAQAGLPPGDAARLPARDAAPGGAAPCSPWSRSSAASGSACTPSGASGHGARDQLGQRRPGGARRGPRQPRQGRPAPGHRPRRGRSRAGPAPAHRGLRGSSRRPRPPRSARASSRRSGPRSSPGSTGCTAWSTVASTPLFTSAGGGRRAVRPRAHGPRARRRAVRASTRTTTTVYRVDLKRKRATAIVREGREAAGTTVAKPRLLAVGGRDLLILDAKNVLWRWRPSNDAGKGTLDPGPRQRRRAVGRRHHGDRDVPPRRRPRALQPVRRRPVRAADPRLLRRRPTAAASRPRRPAGWPPRATSTR